MRVALLSPRFWPEVRRGTERFVRDLGDGLQARGHTARVITSHPGAPSRTVEDGLEIVRVWRPPTARLVRRGFDEHLTHVPLAYAALRAGHDDVAHAVYPTDGVAAARWSTRTGRPAILSYMGIPHRRGMANRRGRVEATLAAVRGARAVVALSEAAADGFQRWLGVTARVIPPGVDLTAFRPDPAARAADPTIFCAADAREPRKRVGLLLDAFARVRRARPGVRLLLARPRGEGPALPEGAAWVDVDDRAALARAYAEAWVTALPSTGEAFGLVLVESLACGTPAVATDAGGMREILRDRPEVGGLFGGDTDAAATAALARALSEAIEERRDPAACRARAEDFSLDRTVDAYLALYAETGAGPLT